MSFSVWSLLPQQLQSAFFTHASVLDQLFITAITSDSRQASAGSLFLALPGTQVDGRDYIAQVFDQGAAFVIAQSRSAQQHYDDQQKILWVESLQQWCGFIAAAFYRWPSRALQLIGVTGTNGKTTVTTLIASMAQQAGLQSAVMGTNGYGKLGALKLQRLTTPDPLLLQRQLAELRDAGIELVAMEVSSHALEQGRVNGCHFHSAILTNIARDHLDYHGDMANYAKAKQMLFSWPELSHAVINIDDAYGAEFYRECTASNRLMYAQTSVVHLQRNGELALDKKTAANAVFAINSLAAQSDLSVQILQESCTLRTRLIGEFNFYNLLAAMTLFSALGYKLSTIAQWVPALQLPEGRMQSIKPANAKADQQDLPQIIVDFAHTPDAISVVLKTLKALAQARAGRLLVVFGCGGDRDRGKRPLMAQAVAEFADQIMVTRDNPRFEDQQQIFADIAQGFNSEIISQVRQLDAREQAIQQVIAGAAAADVIAILGKGHETYQDTQGVRVDFDDRAVAQAAIDHWAQAHSSVSFNS